MDVSFLDILGALVVGGAASALGGYLGGVNLGAKDLGREFAGFMGMLYGPTAGLTGVVVGLVIVAVVATRS